MSCPFSCVGSSATPKTRRDTAQRLAKDALWDECGHVKVVAAAPPLCVSRRHLVEVRFAGNGALQDALHFAMPSVILCPSPGLANNFSSSPWIFPAANKIGNASACTNAPNRCLVRSAAWLRGPPPAQAHAFTGADPCGPARPPNNDHSHNCPTHTHATTLPSLLTPELSALFAAVMTPNKKTMLMGGWSGGRGAQRVVTWGSGQGGVGVGVGG